MRYALHTPGKNCCLARLCHVQLPDRVSLDTILHKFQYDDDLQEFHSLDIYVP